MAQHDYSIANDTGANVRADINNLAVAAATNNAGSSAPSTTYARMWWPDETNGILKQRNAANSAWINRGPLSDTPTVAKSSAYTLVAGDYGRTVTCTSTFTLSVTAAATLGDGWWCNLVNTGSGVITIDPNASETVNGATTLVLAPRESVQLWCTGSAFYTLATSAVRRFFADKNATDQTSVSTATKVTFGTERYDRGGIYDSANSQITGVEGRLSGAAAIFYAGGVVDQLQYGLALWKNGTLHRQLSVVTASGTGSLVVSGPFQEESVASDTWEIRTVFGGGGTVTVGGATTSSYFFAEAA